MKNWINRQETKSNSSLVWNHTILCCVCVCVLVSVSYVWKLESIADDSVWILRKKRFKIVTKHCNCETQSFWIRYLSEFVSFVLQNHYTNNQIREINRFNCNMLKKRNSHLGRRWKLSSLFGVMRDIVCSYSLAGTKRSGILNNPIANGRLRHNTTSNTIPNKQANKQNKTKQINK
jgi:hypothetical protein